MVRYAVIIEKAPDGGYGAYVPDLPGCVGMGYTKEETLENIAEAIQFHIEGMKAEGLPVPLPTTEAENLMLAIA
jgi:predicted RNase H-like HicB family nuclease